MGVVFLQGSDKGLKAIGHSLLIGIQSVDEAKKSPHWEDIRTAMDEEMCGKISNDYGKPILRPSNETVHKSRWVINVFLRDDGSVQ